MDDVGVSLPADGRVPVALTPLVGRAREQAELGALLPAARLLTLLGTGGCGKTRLSAAVAEAARPGFRDGVWWADLASVSGDGLVAAAVAACLGIAQSPGQDAAEAAARYLRARRTLLVIDNCEQVAAGCAVLIERLLTACPDLTVLATSREVLGVPGEQVYRLSGLGLPASDTDRCDAVDLFTERARARLHGFRPGPAEQAAMARLCRGLDGLPLAIELAAARVGFLSVGEIADRLESGEALLRHPSRTAPARHRNLHATLDWSHQLLAEGERALFRRLSCFRGSFTLAAAERVAGAVPDLVGLLAGLADKSLLVAAGQADGYRYRLLETIRQYAEQKLAESGEEPAVNAAHTRFYLGLAEQAVAGLEGPDQARWLNRLELEHDNLRAVLRRTLPAEPEAGARLTALLWPFWYRRGYYHEARAWLEQAVPVALGQPVTARTCAAVLTGAGVLAFLQCDYRIATERLSKARALYEEEGDQVGLATTWQRLGSIAREEGRYADARRLHEESLAIWAELGDEAGVAASQDYLGFVAWLSGDPGRAVDLCGRAVAWFRASRLRQETASAMINLGVATHLTGDDERGAALLQAGLDISMQLGYQEGVAWALHELAVIVAADDPEAAADMLAESLTTHAGLGDRWRVASVVETVAEVAGDPSLAATLLGAAGTLRRDLGAPVPPAERPARDHCLARLRGSLGGPGFGAAWQRGELMTLAETIDAALRAVRAQDGAPGPPAGPGGGDRAKELGLTGRELAVLRLLSQGRTNRQIAAELLISPGTAGVHVSNILRKLGVASRVQAAAMAHRLDRDG